MQDKTLIAKALKNWSFTSKDLAEFVGISATAIRKIKAGVFVGTVQTQAQIALFLKQKIKETIDILDKSQL